MDDQSEVNALIRKIYHAIDRALQAVCGILPEPLLRLVKRLHRMLTYGFMGCINTAIQLLVFSLCYKLLRIPVEISHALGFVCASSHGYLLNSNLTFTEGRGRSRAQFLQYVGVDAVLAALGSFFMGWIETINAPVVLVEAIVAVAVGLIHYVIYKFLVFRIKKDDKNESN